MESTNLLINLFSNNAFLILNKNIIRHYGLHEAVFLSNLVDKFKYFHNRDMDNDGWFFQTEEQIREETGLSIKRIRSCKNKFTKAKWISSERRGIPAKMHYKLNSEIIIKEMGSFPVRSKRPDKKGPSQSGRFDRTSRVETTGLVESKRPDYLIRTNNKNKIKTNISLPTEVGRNCSSNQSLPIGEKIETPPNENITSNPPNNKPIPEKKPRKKRVSTKDKINNSHRMLSRRLFKALIESETATVPGMAESRPEEERKKQAKKLQTNWALDFAKMEFLDSIPIEEIKDTMNWYEQNIDIKFTPEAYCGNAFRKKYQAIIGAINRSKKKQAPKMSPANNARCLREQKPRNLKYGYVDENGDCFDERGRKI